MLCFDTPTGALRRQRHQDVADPQLDFDPEDQGVEELRPVTG